MTIMVLNLTRILALPSDYYDFSSQGYMYWRTHYFAAGVVASLEKRPQQPLTDLDMCCLAKWGKNQ